MKILMISSYLPYPLLSGGQNRLYNLIKELSIHHEITLICEKRENQTINDIKEVEKICQKVITVERRKQWSLKNILKTAFSTHSFLYNGHLHPKMQQKIEQELAKNKLDLIHVETFYVYQNLPCHSREDGNPDPSFPPVILVEHNIEYQVYQRYTERAPFFIRPLLNIDVAKIKKKEEHFWKKANAVAAVSEDDKKIIEQTGVKASVVPNGVNPTQFSLKDAKKATQEKEKRILFIGDFKWIQNRDSVTWIIKQIWPKIKELQIGKKELRDTKIKFWIVGRVIPEGIKNLINDPDVFFDEDVSTSPTWEIFQKAHVQLVPIRVGGGTSYKILESMSCGTPTIITPLSAHALKAQYGKHAQVGQTSLELAQKTIQLLQDAKLYETISLNGRKLIEENYTWKAIAKTLEETYRKAVNMLE